MNPILFVCHFVVMIDYLSKWVKVCAIPDQSSESLVKALLDNVINFANHGAPKELLLDRGADLYI